MDLEIAIDDPLRADVRSLLENHLSFAREVVGALRQLDAVDAEVTSMHTARLARGRGVGRAIVDHLLAEAASRGCRRVSLETGTMAALEPARELYRSIGFTPCGPFGDYTAHDGSVCMTIELSSGDAARL
ncbi:MAG: GNAT family N-acetyltransferase [Acidimicrobiia bacterium]|nr:GNAT family N-acetyltransferase [Acidimicrobiia bacterium]